MKINNTYVKICRRKQKYFLNIVDIVWGTEKHCILSRPSSIGYHVSTEMIL